MLVENDCHSFLISAFRHDIYFAPTGLRWSGCIFSTNILSLTGLKKNVTIYPLPEQQVGIRNISHTTGGKACNDILVETTFYLRYHKIPFQYFLRWLFRQYLQVVQQEN